MSYFKTYSGEESQLPREMLQASRNFSNLYEVPTLFFMICIFGHLLQAIDYVFLGLAYCYVAFRYLHSYIHLTSNKVKSRAQVYAGSWVILLVMAILLMIKV